MAITLQPMLAIIGLSGAEILLILLVMMVPVIIAAVVIFIFLFVQKNTKAATPPKPPAVPPVTQAAQVPRKCPKCGALLKPDAPEGLCPACLLQQGIATEGGVPPGTPAFTPPPLPELAKLFPQLEIIEIIGQGGMGAVYKARQPSLDRFVALKILAPRSGGDLDFAGRFSREARALAKLSHPNIVSVYDYGQVQRSRRREEVDARQTNPPPDVGGYEGHLNYFIMEYVDGPNLRQVEQAGKLTPREALEIIPQICAALQFAHDEGIVHRDIKPENVLLDKKGRVKIADFGLAKILGQDADFRLTGARDVMGTPHYMAPEQVEKPQEVDHRADIYSLGVVFYEMLTGELPLGKFDPPSHKVQIDVRLDDIVLRSLANNPDRRYQQVGDVKTELESISKTAPQFAARPANAANPVANPPPRSSSWIVWTILAVVILGMAFVFVVGLFFWTKENRASRIDRGITPPPGHVATPIPFNANDSAEIYYQVFECDAGTVDDLVPVAMRQAVSNSRFPNGLASNMGTPASFAIIDANKLATLLHHVPAPRLLLVDDHRTVSTPWWNPGLATSWGAGRSEEIAGTSWNGSVGGSGFMGTRRNGTKLEIRLDQHISYSLSPVSTPISPNPIFHSDLFYEGEAPNESALVFLVPFTRQDRSEHYLICAFTVTAAASGQNPQ